MITQTIKKTKSNKDDRRTKNLNLNFDIFYYYLIGLPNYVYEFGTLPHAMS